MILNDFVDQIKRGCDFNHVFICTLSHAAKKHDLAELVWVGLPLTSHEKLAVLTESLLELCELLKQLCKRQDRRLRLLLWSLLPGRSLGCSPLHFVYTAISNNNNHHTYSI